MKNCPINQRMNDNYELRARSYLTRRTPVIMRLDGKAFHTYTRGMQKPFDYDLMDMMRSTAKFLCEEIQGAKMAYTQSDEISILITDYAKLSTNAWFDYQVQKMCSVAASMATAKFNQLAIDFQMTNYNHYVKEIALAFFDCRVFNVPKEEVANYFLARQKDAVENSISMLAQSLYPHKVLQGKNGGEMQEMCFQKGENWNDLPFAAKRGSTVIKESYEPPSTGESETTVRTRWSERFETPLSFSEEFFVDNNLI